MLDAGGPSSSPPVAIVDDLASTPDANTADPYIQELAAKLDHDPTRIFNFVQGQIQYNSYSGSLRGARGTLWSAAGNSLDTASLGVALLRASGIPAWYAHGTLGDADSQRLILSMFPQPLRVTGFIPAGTAVSDPAGDPALLAETRDHYWVQFDTGTGVQDADPLVPGAAIGQSFATADSTFAEVPAALRDTVTLSIQREITTPAAGLFTGGSGGDVATVLQATFNTVDLVGKPVTAGFFVQSSTLSSVFSSTTNVYSPYFLVGGDSLSPAQDQVIRGTDFTETLTNFPFGSQILTGLFLQVVVATPGQPTETYSTTIADRIGAAARASGDRCRSRRAPRLSPS